MILKIKQKIAFPVLCLVPALVFSSAVYSLDMLDAVSDTISAHPQVKEKLHVYRQVLADESIADSGWRPSVDLDASTGVYNTESPATGNSSVDYDSTRVELSVTQNLFNGYDTTNQVEQTKYRARAALFDIYDAADNIALDTIQAYLDVLRQKRLLELANENVNSHETILAQIRERNASGVGRRSQLQQTEGRLARAYASLIAQQNNQQDSLTLFHQLLGRYVVATELVEPEIPSLPADDLNALIDKALQNHPASKVAVNNIAASKSAYDRSRSSRYPNLDLRLASEWGDDLGGVSGDTEELSLTLNLTYNFYDGGADRAEQEKRVSAVYEQKEFAARVRRQIINTLRLAWVADQSLSRQLTYLEQHVIKARETVESYREEFFIGQRDLVDLLDAENELNTAQNQFTGAYYDALAARYRIYEGLGLLFDVLNLETELTDTDLRVARINARAVDQLPLPEDEDQDREQDKLDHCDNTLTGVEVNDFGCLTTATGNVEMGYVQLNREPVAADDELSVDSGGILFVSQEQLLENDSDADNDTLTIVDVGRPGHGKLAFNQDKSLIYRPSEEFVGQDSFTYTLSDGNGGAATAAVTVNVNPTAKTDLSKMQFVNFKYDLAELTDFSKAKVKDIIEQIRRARDIRIEIYTYTDNIGSDRYNQELSDKRARALRQLLIDEGLDGDKIKAIGMGEQNPIADNATKAGQAINRRGEFIFKALDIEQ